MTARASDDRTRVWGAFPPAAGRARVVTYTAFSERFLKQMGMRQMFGLGGGKPKGKLEDAPIAELEALEAKQRGTFGGQLISTALGKAREKKRKADLLTMPNAPDAGPVVITSNLLAARRAGERTRRGAVGDASAQAVAGRTRLG